MSTNEFDRLIAKKASEASYEYDANDWGKFSGQMAAARKKKRTVVFAYTASGIAASVAVFILGIMPMLSKKDVPATQYASKPQIHSAPLSPSNNNGINTQSPATQQAVVYKSSPVKKQQHPAFDTTIKNTPVVAYNNPPVNTPSQPVEKQTFVAPATEQPAKQKVQQNEYGTLMPLAYYEKEKKTDNRGVNISVAGGVNYGTINTGYAVGAAAERKISNKLGIEVTVAYVGNNASAPGQNAISLFLPPNTNPQAKPAAEVDLPLNYLQCAPMADYSLSKKFTLAAGADLQRLLQDHNVSVLYNDEVKVAPIIDLGILLRTEYKISNHLKAGLSYRVGANNVFSSGTNYLDRNYMQVQLKYKLH